MISIRTSRNAPAAEGEAQLFPYERRKPALRHLVKAVTGLLIMVVLAALWQWAPVREWLDVRIAAAYLDDLAAGPVAPLAAKGILAVVMLRLLPVAPFSMVNAGAGASHIRFRDFFLGTLLGELPGLVSLALFIDQVMDTVRHPGLGSLGMLAAIAGPIALALLGTTRLVAAQAGAGADL